MASNNQAVAVQHTHTFTEMPNPARFLPVVKSKGEAILRIYPNLAELHRQMPVRKIVSYLGIEDFFGLSQSIAISAVHYALNQLGKDEKKARSRRHYQNFGYKCQKQGIGIFSMTLQQIHDRNTSSARTRAERKIGFNAEDRSALASAAMAAKGETPWSAEEKAYARAEYQALKSAGAYSIYPALASDLNRRFHHSENVRNPHAVRTEIYRIKKSLEEKIS